MSMCDATRTLLQDGVRRLARDQESTEREASQALEELASRATQIADLLRILGDEEAPPTPHQVVEEHSRAQALRAAAVLPALMLVDSLPAAQFTIDVDTLFFDDEEVGIEGMLTGGQDRREALQWWARFLDTEVEQRPNDPHRSTPMCLSVDGRYRGVPVHVWARLDARHDAEDPRGVPA